MPRVRLNDHWESAFYFRFVQKNKASSLMQILLKIAREPSNSVYMA